MKTYTVYFSLYDAIIENSIRLRHHFLLQYCVNALCLVPSVCVTARILQPTVDSRECGYAVFRLVVSNAVACLYTLML